ncbi:MAG: hypothetical protein M3O99_05890 [Chloroflexota bacterium]|nr:hypothetical protein [Chloroflexota bacterium]
MVDTSTERSDAMPEQPGGGERPELHPLIKDYFANRQLDYNNIPAHTYETLRHFPAQHVQVLVDVLNAVGQSLEADTRAPDEIGEGVESDETMTPLEKYRFVIH